jgi:hypothetical protein
MTLERLKELLNSNFCSPYLKDGYVLADWKDKKKTLLNIDIGPRNIQINEAGEVQSARTLFESDDQDILPSEAVFGFISWLTTRPGTLKIGEKHSCSELLDLICDWCDVNYLIPPREKNYPNNIAFPIEKK